MNKKVYTVSLRHGKDNAKRHELDVLTVTAWQAVERFLCRYFPEGFAYYPLKSEQPKEINGVLYQFWSVKNDISGQSIWIKSPLYFGE